MNLNDNSIQQFEQKNCSGYWAFDVVAGEPFPAPAGEDQGLLLHLLQAITWAQELDLKVM